MRRKGTAVAETTAPGAACAAGRPTAGVGPYLARVQAEPRSQHQLDDLSADSARRETPEIVPIA